MEAMACFACASATSLPLRLAEASISSSPSRSLRNTFHPQHLRLKSSIQKSNSERRCCSFAARPAISQLSDFSNQEAKKFHEAVMEQLEEDKSVGGEVKAKIVDICTKIFGKYVDRYEGTLSSEMFKDMEMALAGEGLPGSAALRAAIGWARCHLYHDWQVSKGLRK